MFCYNDLHNNLPRILGKYLELRKNVLANGALFKTKSIANFTDPYSEIFREISLQNKVIFLEQGKVCKNTSFDSGKHLLVHVKHSNILHQFKLLKTIIASKSYLNQSISPWLPLAASPDDTLTL